MTVGRITICQALHEAGREDNDSVAKITEALEKHGLDCNLDDARGAFSELEGWAVMLPPLELDAHQAQIIKEAQRFVGLGAWLPDTHPHLPLLVV